MPLGNRWGQSEFRTPPGMRHADWRVSPEYRSLKKEYDRRRHTGAGAERRRAAGRAYDNTATGRARRLLTTAKHRAAKKGLSFGLSLEWVLSRVEAGHCELTNLPFVYVRGNAKRKHPFSPSLDRIDITKGYTPDNCRVVLWAVNVAIADFGMDVYLDIARVMLSKHGGGAS